MSSYARLSRLASQLGARRQVRCYSAQTGTGWGFVGLGQMGYPIARNLLAKLAVGDRLVIQDVNAAATARFLDEAAADPSVKAEVVVAANVRELAEGSLNVITVLPEPQHVKSVYRDMIGASSPLPPTDQAMPRLFIDCSTIDPASSSQVAGLVGLASNAKFVDAPMSGGVVGARAGTLTFMLGCDPDVLGRATDVLEKVGQKILHLGPPGSGVKGKLANNYLLAVANVATAEAMSMGIRWGLDRHALAGLINASTGRCWPTSVNNPVPGVIEGAPASRDYDGGFGVALANKDLRLAVDAAGQAGVKLALGQATVDVYGKMTADDRFRTKDFSVVYRYLGGQE